MEEVDVFGLLDPLVGVVGMAVAVREGK